MYIHPKHHRNDADYKSYYGRVESDKEFYTFTKVSEAMVRVLEERVVALIQVLLHKVWEGTGYQILGGQMGKKKSLICSPGKSMTPCRYSLLFLPATRSSPSQTLEGVFEELTRRTSIRPLTHLVRCFRNYRDTRTPSGVPR